VGSLLTTGRPPKKRVQRGVRLAEAYNQLQWEDPLEYAQKRRAKGHERGLGTSSLMLVELYLDMHLDQSSLLRGPVDFLVLCESASSGSKLRDRLEAISDGLKLPVDLDKVRFFPFEKDVKSLGTKMSWSIFCDHSVKKGEPRLTGPTALIRKVELGRPTKQGERCWGAYSRDHERVALLPQKGKEDVLKLASCPLTVIEGGNEVTHSAALLQKIHALTRLQKAFEK